MFKIKTNTLILHSLIFTITLMPWLHGGERIWEHHLFFSLIYAIAAITLIKFSFGHYTSPKSLIEIKTPLVLLFIWVLYLLIQVMPLPQDLVNTILPSTIESLISNIRETYNQSSTISFSPETSQAFILKYIGYIIFFILTFIALENKNKIMSLARFIFFTSAAMSLYSSLNYINSGDFVINDSLMPYANDDWSKKVRGAFSYPANYASFLLLTIPIGLGLLFINIKKSKLTYTPLTTGSLISRMVISNAHYITSLMLMMCSLLNTSSRAGVLSFIMAAVVSAIVVGIQNKQSPLLIKKYVIYFFPPFVLVILILVLTGSASNIIDRYLTDGFHLHGREYSNQTSRAILKEHFIFGTGTGTHPIVSPIYKVFEYGVSVRSINAHALNDYVEFLTEQGIIGFTLFSSAIFCLLLKLFKGLQYTPQRTWGLQVSCFFSCIAILMHSAFDFNFQLPINTVLFFIILALGLKLQILNTIQRRSSK